MVGFGPRNLTCEIESAGAGGGIAVTLCRQRHMKTPGQLPGRAFPLTVTGDKVRQIDFGSPNGTLFINTLCLSHFAIRLGIELGRNVVFQMAEVAIPRGLFRAILDRIRRLRLPEAVPR